MNFKSVFLLTIFSIFLGMEEINCQYIGGDLDDYGVSICQLDDGYIILGSTRSSGAGSDDLWAIRLDNILEVIDNRVWGGVHRDIASKVVSGCDNTYVVVSGQWDLPGSRTGVQIARYNADGSLLWNYNFESPHEDRVYDVVRKSDCGYLVTGYAKGIGQSGSAFLLNLDSGGSLIWSANFDLPFKDIGSAVSESDDGYIYWAVSINSFMDKVADSAEYLSDDTSGIVLLKYNSSGEELWQQDLSTQKHDFASRLITDDENGCYLLGSSMTNDNGSFDMTLHQVDADGNFAWRQTYGEESFEYGNSMLKTEAGDLLLVGTADRFEEGLGMDIQVIKVDLSGNVMWSQYLGSENNEEGNEAIILDDGSIGIIGSGQVDETLHWDMYLGLLSSDGEVLAPPFYALDPEISGIQVFPNPMTEYVWVNIDPDEQGSSISLELVDNSGKIVFTATETTGPTAVRFHPSLASGAYHYSILHKETLYHGRLIVE